MKNTAFNRRKLRYASTSVLLTALIIAAIIVFNIIFSALGTKFLWYVDLTPDQLFTLSDECFELIEKGDEQFGNSTSPIEMINKFREENKKFNADNGLSKTDAGYKDEEVMIRIIFCDEIDTLEASLVTKYVYHTALELQLEFPEYIEVVNYDTVRNPSSVSQYKKTANDYIAPSSVIVTCGSEFRLLDIRSFYTFETVDAEEPWAYNAEKKFAASILSVTRAETPIAGIVTNHGESFPSIESAYALEDAGYEIREIDLSKDEIPENCRLLLICNPQADFMVADGVSPVDEIDKLDKFLDQTNSLMVFMSPDSPVLKNLEEYLEEWGVVFDRYKDTVTGQVYPKLISDKTQSSVSDISGYTLFADYVTKGMGGTITESMRDVYMPPPVVFKNAMPIAYSPLYSLDHYTDEDDPAKSYDFASYSVDGTSRAIFDVFSSGKNAVAYANGIEVGRATEQNPFKLMTVTVEERETQESNYTMISEASYVIACSSVEFLDSVILQNNSYGNSDVLLSAFRAVGKEPVPVGLNPKPFADKDISIDILTAEDATQYTVVLTVIPAVIALVTGIVIIIRRKNR